ncbi:MAG TPA: PRC-barrel domain-containing protein [Myxococcaceae bacterium]|nr:PRC-barrel domain-containing protein [Myxococcaceae bacterium]
MDARRGIAEGMTVYTRDGEKLGKVVAVDANGLFVEKGFFFPSEYGFHFVDVADVRDGEVHLRVDKEEVSKARVEDEQGLERRRPNAVSEDRDPRLGRGRSDEAGLPGATSTRLEPEDDAAELGVPATETRGGRQERPGSHTARRVIGTGSDSTLLVDQAEPIVEEIEEEEPRRPNPRDPDDHHVL